MLAGLPLFSDGRRAINPASGIQIWQHNFHIPPACTRVEQVSVCVQPRICTIREDLEALANADKCAQYDNDIGTASINVDELIFNIETVIHQIKKAGLKFSMSKCAFGHTKTEVLGKIITITKGILSLGARIYKFLKNLKLPTSVKSLQLYIGFVQFYRQYIPKLAEKLIQLYKLLQKDVKIALTQVHKNEIFDINESLTGAAKLSLRLPLPDKQLVIICDASEQAAGYVLLVEDYTETNDGKKKTYAPLAFSLQRFTACQLSLTMYAKEFLTMHFAFDEFAHILWEVKTPTIVTTDSKAQNRFFQSKRFPPKLWNHCDQELHFDCDSTLISYLPTCQVSRIRLQTSCLDSISTPKTGST